MFSTATPPPASPLAAVEQALAAVLETLDPAVVSGSDAQEALARFGRIANMAAHGARLMGNRVDETKSWKNRGHASAAESVADALGCSTADAARELGTARKLGGLEATDRAARRGELSPTKAGHVADAGAVDPSAEADLLDLASRGSAAEVRDESRRRRHAAAGDDRQRHRRIRRNRALRLWIDDEGAAHLSWQDVPEHGAEVGAILDPYIEQRFHQARRAGLRDRRERYAADAFLDALRDAAAFRRGDSLADETVPGEGPANATAGAPAQDADARGSAPSGPAPAGAAASGPAPSEPAATTSAAPHAAPRGTAGAGASAAGSNAAGSATATVTAPGASTDRVEAAGASAASGVAATPAAPPGSAATAPSSDEPAAHAEAPRSSGPPGPDSSGTSGPEPDARVARPTAPTEATRPAGRSTTHPSGHRPDPSPTSTSATSPDGRASRRGRPPPDTPNGPSDDAPLPAPTGWRTPKRRGADAKVIVRIDHTALRRGHTEAGEVCEIAGVGPVPVASVVELMDDAFLAAVIVDGTDIVNVAHLGRSANAHQTTAIQAQARRCTTLGCPRTARLENDHADPWVDTHVTRLHGLDPSCDHCHDLKSFEGHRHTPGRGPRPLLSPAEQAVWNAEHPDDPIAPLDPPGRRGRGRSSSSARRTPPSTPSAAERGPSSPRGEPLTLDLDTEGPAA